MKQQSMNIDTEMKSESEGQKLFLLDKYHKQWSAISEFKTSDREKSVQSS